MDLLEVGKIVNTHGLRGEVKVVPWTDTPELFEQIDFVFVCRRGQREKLTLQNIKYQKQNLIVKFQEIQDIDQAQLYKNMVLSAPREMLGELPEGVYYITDLIGLSVMDEAGNKIGVLSDVFQTGSNDVYTVKREGKKDLLLPVIENVVLQVDLERGTVMVRVMEGLDEE